jgi:TolB protein
MRRSLSFLLFIMLAAVASAERTLDLGVISRVATGKTVPVAWEVHSRAIEPLLNKAFASYGGFVRVSPEQAAVKIDLSALSTEAVRLELVKDDAVIYSEDFSGSSLSGAALAAADRAVEKIMGLPGFFSGKIAFISDKTGSTEVYVSDLFFQNIQRITTDGALATGPKLSPDGRYLNYTSYCRGGFPDLLKGTSKPCAVPLWRDLMGLIQVEIGPRQGTVWQRFCR